jgi:hypothetical protein
VTWESGIGTGDQIPICSLFATLTVNLIGFSVCDVYTPLSLLLHKFGFLLELDFFEDGLFIRSTLNSFHFLTVVRAVIN